MEHQNTTILYNVPKVAYGMEGCTPFPMSLHACARYLGVQADYTQIMAQSGAAFRLTWDTSCWNGGNVDALFAFDQPHKLFVCGMRAIGRSLKLLERTPDTGKEEFKAFIREEIDSGHPVIALGIIGPPEACVIAGYREGGETLLGWNCFQEYPEYQNSVQIETNGYFVTSNWWENPETQALIATGAPAAVPFSLKEALEIATEVLAGRMCDSYAKGLLAYDAWKEALLCHKDFPQDAVFPILVERMMCHGDAMDCLSDGRLHGAKYLRRLAGKYPTYAESLQAAAQEFEKIVDIIWKEMIPILGGWERGEKQIRKLADPKNRQLFAAQIDRMKAHDKQAYSYLCQLLQTLS